MEIWRRLTGADISPKPIRPNPKTKQRYWENLSPAEHVAISGYTDALQAQRVQLGGVDLLVLGVGSYARQVRGERVAPRDIDLRVVTSAPVGSELQERVVSGAERLTRDYLDAKLPDYTQMSGFRWHLVETDSRGKVEMVPFADYDPNNIRFVVGARTGRRTLDLIISGHGQFDIERHLAKETESGGKIVTLLDTRQLPVAAAVSS